jgi:hypothetical protein
MHRLIPLFLTALALAGCGSAQSSGGAAGGAPAPADLAADAVAALEAAGSAHYLVDADVQGNGDAGFDGGLHVEGDASTDAFTANGTVRVGGASFSGQVLAGRDELFLNFMGQWYGDRNLGLGEADEETPSVDEVRQYFDEVFTGSVGEGPVVDGAATWRFEGKLNPDGFADLTERFDNEDVSEAQRELLRVVAENSRFALDVGQEDSLPRHLEFALELSSEDLATIGDGLDASELGDLLDFDVHATLDLSEFGKDVSYEAPADYRPLEDLVDQLFSGLE